MSENIKFGTDGWRGRIAEDYTFDNVRRCAQGYASYLINQKLKDEWVIVGYDRRFLSEHFAAAAAEVIAANNLRVYLTETATPTPVVSYSIIAKNAVAGVNITASHNPPTDNGFKVRDRHGGAVDPMRLKEIEDRIPALGEKVKRISIKDAESKGLIQRFDPSEAYIEQVHRLIDLKPIKDAGINILVDPMWGNGIGWFQRFLQGGKTKIEEIHNIRNPIFPEMLRPEPIPPNVNVGLQETLNRQADVLIITDGDADRLGVGDERGQFIDQLRVFGLMAYYLLEVRGERGPIVKTLSTTNMLNKLGKIYNVPVYETGVGFKYVAPKMLETDALIGGEESGGYAFRGHVPERDGLLAGLYLLDLMIRVNKRPTELLKLLFDKVGVHFYDRIDKPFNGDRKSREQLIETANPSTIGGLKVTGLETLDGYKFNLEDGGWLLIRFSGTESIIRVYTETMHEDKVSKILEDGLAIAGIN